MYTKEPAYKDAEGSLYEEGGPEARGVLELAKATVAEEKNPPAGRYGFKVTTEAGNVWDLRAELIDDRDAVSYPLQLLENRDPHHAHTRSTTPCSGWGH